MGTPAASLVTTKIRPWADVSDKYASFIIEWRTSGTNASKTQHQEAICSRLMKRIGMQDEFTKTTYATDPTLGRKVR